MSFYLKPPRGVINIYNLEECVKHRLSCYEKLHNGSNIADTEAFGKFLAEDSALDRTGHYLFRLAAFCNNVFKETFLRSEERLLDLRLNSLTNYKYLRNFIKKLGYQVVDCSQNVVNQPKIEGYFECLKNICMQMLQKNYLLHVLDPDFPHGCDSCVNYNIQVPFEYCFNLLPRREIILQNGLIHFTCINWKIALLSLYHTYLTLTLRRLHNIYDIKALMQDERICSVINLIQSRYNGFESTNKSTFDIRCIDDESIIFPLCMRNLYDTLKMTNRLSHNSRFNFSLYIKDIGVSMSDSIKLWQHAYSKEHATCSKCTHSWKDSEKRYVYGIRHLYGLEGARKNYSVRSCSQLQEMSSAAIEGGGCPFKHFDDENLRKYLQLLLPNFLDFIEVMIFERQHNPSEACKIFSKCTYESVVSDSDSNKITLNDFKFVNPAQYYLALRQSLDGINL